MGIKSLKRKNEIVSRLERKGSVSVAELVVAFNVSEVTIRRDLEELEGRGLLLRTYGGAVNREENEISPEFVFNEKQQKNIFRKKAIAKAAFEYVASGETIFLDSGTTTLEIARLIKEKDMDLTVVTNSMPVVTELLHEENLNLFLLFFVLHQLNFLRRHCNCFYLRVWISHLC